MEKNEPDLEEEGQEEGPNWPAVIKFGSLALAATPWVLYGYALINATRPPAEMQGFSGFVTNIPPSTGTLGTQTPTDACPYTNDQLYTMYKKAIANLGPLGGLGGQVITFQEWVLVNYPQCAPKS